MATQFSLIEEVWGTEPLPITGYLKHRQQKQQQAITTPKINTSNSTQIKEGFHSQNSSIFNLLTISDMFIIFLLFVIMYLL